MRVLIFALTCAATMSAFANDCTFRVDDFNDLSITNEALESLGKSGFRYDVSSENSIEVTWKSKKETIWSRLNVIRSAKDKIKGEGADSGVFIAKQTVRVYNDISGKMIGKVVYRHKQKEKGLDRIHYYDGKIKVKKMKCNPVDNAMEFLPVIHHNF